MIPDKIYLCADAPRVYDWSNIPFEKGGNIEYIRKDALLEWLKMKTETAEIVVANSVNRWVTRQVYKQVMDKLNSM